MVGTLVDERADLQDVIATLLDLAKRGVLEIEEEQHAGFLGIGSNSDFTYRRKPNNVQLRAYEELFLKEFFGRKDEVKLSDLKNKFYSTLPTLRSALYKEVVAEGLFSQSPDNVRSQFGCLGGLVLGVGLLGAFFLSALLTQLSNYAICLPIGIGIIGIGIIILARFMPRRTAKGRGSVRPLDGVQALPAEPGEIHQG